MKTVFATQDIDEARAPRKGRVRWRLMLLYFFLLQSALHLSASAQPYDISKSTIDGGRGTSTGGVHSVSGTIGQPDAGSALTSGPYAVTGGFWALPQAVQTPGAPLLSIAAAGVGFAEVSWIPYTGTNWVLQETLSLSPPSWMHSPSGSTNPCLCPPRCRPSCIG